MTAELNDEPVRVHADRLWALAAEFSKEASCPPSFDISDTP